MNEYVKVGCGLGLLGLMCDRSLSFPEMMLFFADGDPVAEDDGFGDFLQGPTPPANTPQTPESGPQTPVGQQAAVDNPQSSPKDEGFGEFLRGHQSQQTDGEKDFKPEGSVKTQPHKEVKKGKEIPKINLLILVDLCHHT